MSKLKLKERFIMRTITKKFKVYKFDELDKKGKEKAINDEIQVILDLYDPDSASPKVKKAVEKADRLHTPWFAGSIIWEMCEKEILETLRDEEFYENGKVYIDN